MTPGSDAREDLARLILAVPDFPEAGIVFQDITPLLADAGALRRAVAMMAATAPDADVGVGIESRGFIVAAPIACAIGAGFVPVRKLGRLPRATERAAYDLEYGSNTVEIHRDAIAQGARVLLVDDVLATGGTLAAAASLVERLGGRIAGISVLIELEALRGRERLGGRPVSRVLTY
ncbi:MAG: adenine phosphoribosyltransferase [Chloroflexota bacterium]